MRKEWWDFVGFPLADKLIQTSTFNHNQIKRIARSLTGKRKVLELAPGFGNLTQQLLKKDKIVYGLDISEKALKYIRRKIGLNQNLHLKKGDARAIPLQSNSFDAVTEMSTFNRYEPRIYRGAYRVLRPKGIFVIVGIEDVKKHNALLAEEATHAKLVLTPAEIRKCQKLAEFMKRREAKTAPLQTILHGLRKTGFRIKSRERFHSKTAYCVVAQK